MVLVTYVLNRMCGVGHAPLSLLYSDVSVSLRLVLAILLLPICHDSALLSVCRCDCIDAHRKHCVCSGSRSVHDPPQCPRHHGHAHLPSLPFLQTHRSASRGRAHGEMGERMRRLHVGQKKRQSETHGGGTKESDGRVRQSAAGEKERVRQKGNCESKTGKHETCIHRQ